MLRLYLSVHLPPLISILETIKMADSKKRDSRGLYLGRALLWQALLWQAFPYRVDSLPLHPSSHLLEMVEALYSFLCRRRRCVIKN
jgi:hypothetical protein